MDSIREVLNHDPERMKEILYQKWTSREILNHNAEKVKEILYLGWKSGSSAMARNKRRDFLSSHLITV